MAQGQFGQARQHTGSPLLAAKYPFAELAGLGRLLEHAETLGATPVRVPRLRPEDIGVPWRDDTPNGEALRLFGCGDAVRPALSREGTRVVGLAACLEAARSRARSGRNAHVLAAAAHEWRDALDARVTGLALLRVRHTVVVDGKAVGRAAALAVGAINRVARSRLTGGLELLSHLVAIEPVPAHRRLIRGVVGVDAA